jgi:hypothetical protein
MESLHTIRKPAEVWPKPGKSSCLSVKFGLSKVCPEALRDVMMVVPATAFRPRTRPTSPGGASVPGLILCLTL